MITSKRTMSEVVPAASGHVKTCFTYEVPGPTLYDENARSNVLAAAGAAYASHPTGCAGGAGGQHSVVQARE